MSVSKKHFVVFMSPGTFFAETSERPIESWDPRAAAALSEQIVERYNAVPYGFYFETRLCADPVPDGTGGTLEVKEKLVARSGTYFFGKLETLDEIEARNDPKEAVLRFNMRCNDYPIVAVSTRSWRSVQPFEIDSLLVGPDGAILERGDDPKHVAYRAAKARPESPSPASRPQEGG